MRKRNCSIHLRLSEKEAEDFRERAKRTGVNIQTYFLWLLYDRPIREAPPIEYQEVLKNLREINFSMHGLAMKAALDKDVDSEKYWRNIEELQKTIGKLMEEVYS